MKVVKKVFFGITFLIILGCLGVLVCAMNPSLTDKLASVVQNMEKSSGSGQQPNTPGDPNNPADPNGQQNNNPADPNGQQNNNPADPNGQQNNNPGDPNGQQNNNPTDPNGQSNNAANPNGQPNAAQSTGGSVGINTNWKPSGEASYVAPQTSPAAPPEEVSMRGGFTPIEQELQEIPTEEADALKDTVATGEVDDSLTFDSETYPYYAMLETDLQQLYKQIYTNAQNLVTSFTPAVEVNVNEVKTVFEAVYNDHPELFWLETGYSCKYLKSGKCVEIVLKYNDTIDTLDQAKADFAESAEKILSGAREQETPFDQEKYVHDALLQLVEYNENAAYNQSAYSALVKGESVCAGYARAFQYLMQQLDIPCYYCTGSSGEDHAWNIIKLGDTYYNVDVTWDDTDPATYDYFNKSDAEFADTHVRTGLSVYLPACGGSSGQTNEVSQGVRDLINENPTQPLEWVSKTAANTSDADKTAEQIKQENLEKAGITEDEVLDTMEKYYQDCLEQMKKVGTGEQQFTNVVPESLWSTIEQAYSSGDYQKGYVEDALKALNAGNFAIQLQAERLGGGYYRLYHTIYTE